MQRSLKGKLRVNFVPMNLSTFKPSFCIIIAADNKNGTSEATGSGKNV